MFKVTAYSKGWDSVGTYASGTTATGHRVRVGMVASDWRILKPGTRIRIQGIPGTYTVRDKGGMVRGKHIDIYMPTQWRAKQHGVKHLKIWRIK